MVYNNEDRVKIIETNKTGSIWIINGRFIKVKLDDGSEFKWQGTTDDIKPLYEKEFSLIMSPSEEWTNLVFYLNELKYTEEQRFGNSGTTQAQHLYIVSKETLVAGDHCMFYNSLSKVLEVNDTHAKIESITVVSKEDAELINSIKGEGTSKEGDFGKMIHSFSLSQLPKVIASTNKNITPNHLIPESYKPFFIKKYWTSKNNQDFFKVTLEVYDKEYGFSDHRGIVHAGDIVTINNYVLINMDGVSTPTTSPEEQILQTCYYESIKGFESIHSKKFPSIYYGAVMKAIGIIKNEKDIEIEELKSKLQSANELAEKRGDIIIQYQKHSHEAVAKSKIVQKGLYELAVEVKLQLEYLNEKFKPTGTTASTLSKIESTIKKMEEDGWNLES